MSGERVRAQFWAQAEASWITWPDHPPVLRSIRVRKITQRRPREPEPGCVLVKITVTLPKGAFVPPVLEGFVDVPPEHVEQVPVTVGTEEP
jgi:hypothetical protein